MEREKLNFSSENLTPEQTEIVRETKEKKEKIAEKAAEIGDAGKRMDEIKIQAKNLQKKYPEYGKYVMYHLLIGSTAPSSCTEFDFPGEDSVEKLVDKAYRKIFPEEGEEKE